MSTFEPSNSDTYFGLPSGLAGWAGGGGFFKEATWGGRGGALHTGRLRACMQVEADSVPHVAANSI